MAKQRQRWHLAANSSVEEEDKSDQRFKAEQNRGIKDMRTWEIKSTGNEDEMRADQFPLISHHSDLITQSPSEAVVEMMALSIQLSLWAHIPEIFADAGHF